MIAVHSFARALLGLSLLCFTHLSIAISLNPGDIIVADYPSKNIIRIDPDSGAQQIINAEPLPGHPLELIVLQKIFYEPFGFGREWPRTVARTEVSIKVLLDTVDAIIELNPELGDYSYVSNLEGLIKDPVDMFQMLDSLFVTTGNNASVIKIDLISGEESILSEGNLLSNASAIGYSLKFDDEGKHYFVLLVANNLNNSLVEIDTTTGVQTLSTQGQFLNQPSDFSYALIATPFGIVFSGAPTISNGADGNILKYNNTNGEQSIVFQSEKSISPSGITSIIGNLGEEAYILGDAYSRQILRIEINSGTSSVVSSGGYLNQITGVAKLPYPDLDDDDQPDNLDRCPNSPNRVRRFQLGSCYSRIENIPTLIQGCYLYDFYKTCENQSGSFKEFKRCAKEAHKTIHEADPEYLLFTKPDLHNINRCIKPKYFDFG